MKVASTATAMTHYHDSLRYTKMEHKSDHLVMMSLVIVAR